MTDKEEAAAALRDAQMQHMNSMLNRFSQQGMASAHQTAQIHPPPPLTKPPGHYLTGYEGSECEQIKPVSVQWLEDKNEASSYSDGYSQGFAGGLNFTSQSGYEDKPKEFEGVKFKPQGIDTDEFKKQCEDIDKGES